MNIGLKNKQTFTKGNIMFKKYSITELKSASNPRVANFIKSNHYSGSVSRGNKHVFILQVNGHIRGVATFGTPVGKGCQKYSSGKGVVLECKRFCLAPNAPKNAASFFMAKCLKALKKHKNIDSIISYADPAQGHEGIIYKASNYAYLGVQKYKGQAIIMKGKVIHLRAAYQKINGGYTKTARKVKLALQNKTARYISLPKKHIFCYPLKK